VEPALETTVICDVPPATLMAKKKPASASSALQTRTTRQKAAATIARPAATARTLPAVSVTKPQPAKGASTRFILILSKTKYVSV